VVLGQALHQVDELLPSSSLPFDDIAAAVLLVFFGVKTLQVRLLLFLCLQCATSVEVLSASQCGKHSDSTVEVSHV